MLILIAIRENKAAGGGSFFQGVLNAIPMLPRLMQGESIILGLLGIAALVLFSQKRYRLYVRHSFAGHVVISSLVSLSINLTLSLKLNEASS